MDQVNVKPHFSLETTIFLCSATQTSPCKSHCLRLSRSNGRIKPEENSDCLNKVTGLFHLKEEQTNLKLTISGF